MKRLFFFMLMLTALLTANSQVISDVKIEGQQSEFIKKLKDKGWKVVKYVESIPVLSGKLGNYSGCEMFIFSTKSGNVARVVVFLSEQQNWYDLANRYSSLVDAFTQKFGEPSQLKAEFESPYELGDGYEATAVRTEKTNIAARWLDVGNANYEVSISKYMQVKIVIENDANSKILSRQNKDFFN